jgi:serine/threonine-protein kinase HipA
VTIELPSVVAVAEADVYKAGRLAARLTRTPDGVRFGYVEGYDGLPVATTLPVNGETVLRPGGALPRAAGSARCAAP